MEDFEDFVSASTMDEDLVRTPHELKGDFTLAMELALVLRTGMEEIILPNAPTFAIREQMEKAIKAFNEAGVEISLACLMFVEFIQANPED